MLLSTLLQSVSYTGDFSDQEITELVYDSRKIQPGCAFVCLKGTSFDGHDFAQEAAQKGAVAIIAEKPVSSSVPVLLVQNTRHALALLSAAWFGYPAHSLHTIGITGTKGKTTSSYMIQHILEAQGFRVGVIGTIGVKIGEEIIPLNNTTPESYEVQKYMRRMVDAGCKFCVMEVSSIGLKSHRVAGISFDAGLFTNFSEDHIGGNEHKDMQEYLHCKSLLFRQCKTGVVNMDDENVQGILKDHTCQVKTYGFSSEAQLRAVHDRLCSRPGFLGVAFDLEGDVSFPVEVSIPGRFNIYNALGAIGVCLLVDVSQKAIQEGLSHVSVKGRVEPVRVPGNYSLFIDYAHNAVSMESILSTIRAYHPKRIVCMFGAGGNRPRARRYEMGEICGRMADLSVITEDNSRFENVMDIIDDIKTGIDKTGGKYIVIPNRRDAMRWCIENARDGDVIIFAGKGHEDYQEIRGVKYPFDERVVIQEIFKDLEAKHHETDH